MAKWQTNETVVIWLILFGLILMAFVIFIAIYIKISSDKIQDHLTKENEMKLAYQQSLLKIYISAQEEERARIASDIHDELIGKLVAAKIQLEKTGNHTSIQLLSKGINLARLISHNLHDPWIEIQSFKELIINLLEEWEDKFLIIRKIDIRHKNQFTTETKTQIMRILQELLVNIEKHAKASKIKLHIRWTTENLNIILKDNGQGFLLNCINTGRGLKNIETRVQFLKGHYKIKSKINRGTTVIIYLNH